MAKEWFETWFDSPYYEMLYAHRDEDEARKLIDNMLASISFPPPASIIDVGCGNGRHALYLADKGYEVTGVDISERSIKEAREEGQGKADFYIHDMRDPLPGGPYDMLLNLFTSFGYFSTDEEMKSTLSNFANALNHKGFLVLDYFNARTILNNLVNEETITKNGYTFHIKRYKDGKFLVKEIEVENGKSADRENYYERVRLLNEEDFEHLLEEMGFQVKFCCGDYEMSPFWPNKSPRLIIIACKER